MLFTAVLQEPWLGINGSGRTSPDAGTAGTAEITDPLMGIPLIEGEILGICEYGGNPYTRTKLRRNK
jgi:hypothetical protein